MACSLSVSCFFFSEGLKMNFKIATLTLAAMTTWAAIPEDADAGCHQRKRTSRHQRSGSPSNACCGTQYQTVSSYQPMYHQPSYAQPVQGACCGQDVSYGGGYPSMGTQQGYGNNGQVYGTPAHGGQSMDGDQGGYQQGYGQASVSGNVGDNRQMQGNVGDNRQMQGNVGVQGPGAGEVQTGSQHANANLSGGANVGGNSNVRGGVDANASGVNAGGGANAIGGNVGGGVDAGATTNQ